MTDIKYLDCALHFFTALTLPYARLTTKVRMNLCSENKCQAVQCLPVLTVSAVTIHSRASWPPWQCYASYVMAFAHVTDTLTTVNRECSLLSGS